jgi:hypothetical protein
MYIVCVLICYSLPVQVFGISWPGTKLGVKLTSVLYENNVFFLLRKQCFVLFLKNYPPMYTLAGFDLTTYTQAPKWIQSQYHQTIPPEHENNTIKSSHPPQEQKTRVRIPPGICKVFRESNNAVVHYQLVVCWHREFWWPNWPRYLHLKNLNVIF